MNNLIRPRARSYNVGFRLQRAPHLATLQHHHRPRKPSPRPLTTTTPFKNPTQTRPRNLDIFLPKPTNTDPLSVLLETSAAPIRPDLRPVTTHHDLPSYLAATQTRVLSAPTTSARQKLTTSTVYLGTRYEYLIQSHLQAHLGFTLTRIGGKGDGGVDLIGNWTVPVPVSVPVPSTDTDTATDGPTAPSFRILLQAKRMAPTRTPMPSLMRELDGTVHSSSTSRWISGAFAMHGVRTATLTRAPSQSLSQPPSPKSKSKSITSISDLSHLPTLGILVTTRPLTSGVEKAMAESRRCLMYICLEEVEDSGVQDEMVEGSSLALSAPATKVRQMAWNAAASRAGLEGYDVVTKYTNDENRIVGGSGEAIMMFQGQPLRPL